MPLTDQIKCSSHLRLDIDKTVLAPGETWLGPTDAISTSTASRSKLNYLWIMRTYLQFSLCIPVSIAKMYFFCIVMKHAKIPWPLRLSYEFLGPSRDAQNLCALTKKGTGALSVLRTYLLSPRFPRWGLMLSVMDSTFLVLIVLNPTFWFCCRRNHSYALQCILGTHETLS